jgi:hypothetical protein
MFVNKEQIQIGAMNFIENEIAKKAVGATKFLTYFAMPIISKKATQIIDSFAENPLTKDLFDTNENVDIDAVYNMAKDAIQKSGQFVVYGVVLNETDIDKIHTYIRNTSTSNY